MSPVDATSVLAKATLRSNAIRERQQGHLVGPRLPFRSFGAVFASFGRRNQVKGATNATPVKGRGSPAHFRNSVSRPYVLYDGFRVCTRAVT